MLSLYYFISRRFIILAIMYFSFYCMNTYVDFAYFILKSGRTYLYT